MLSNVCMECHREPVPFESDTGQTLYWMVGQAGTNDPTVLMSNLETLFVTSPEKQYNAKEGEIFMCINCFEKINARREEE